MTWLTYRGSVNRWECDENDHLNVRYFVDRHWQTLAAGVRRADTAKALQVMHLRFIAEARLSQTLSGYFGLLPKSGLTAQAQTVLRDTHNQRILSTCWHELVQVVEGPDVEPLPEAGSRGVPSSDLPYVGLGMDGVGDLGFEMIGAGSILAAECDTDGALLPAGYMGRLSDAMPHLWHHMHGGNVTAEEGGAVLEYRLRFHAPLRSGEAFAIYSGVYEVGRKVQQFAHLMFNVGSGQLVLSAQAAGVRMDLNTRKSVTLDDARMAGLSAAQLQRP